LCELIRRERIEAVVMGLPKNMNATEGERAEKCKALAAELESRTGVPVVLWDERRTTIEAHAILHATGKKQKKHKKSVDAVAATLILQGYLDRKRMSGGN
ncbi:MAG: Holliday junction resolvase RuvX, partial [Butyricicoccaceae bacterium]